MSTISHTIPDLQLEDVHDDDMAHLRHLLASHGVVVLSGQRSDDSAFVAFLQRFGRLTFTKGERPVAGFPDLNVVSNVGRSTPARSVFHVDTSYVRRPPAYTALRAVEIPSQGGHTLFTDQYRAFDTLPSEVRAKLQGRSIRHVVTGLDLGPDDEKEAEHPVFLQHPISGRTSLFISTPERCVAISGMAQAESDKVLRFLYAWSITDTNIYRHTWTPGDVVMWDNRCVMHRADHTEVVGNRVLHRGLVAAEANRKAGGFSAA